MTPSAAIAAGANYLVVGRPIIAAVDPKAAAQPIVAEIAQQAARRHAMAKGYWIGHVDVTTTKATSLTPPLMLRSFRKFGGRFVVRAGKFESLEGTSRPRNMVIEFPDYAAAVACYRSPEYQANIKVRQPHSTVDMIIVEGYEGLQP